jgi:hypothetical protein
MSKLDDILDRSFEYRGTEFEKDKQDIKDLILELIGEDFDTKGLIKSGLTENYQFEAANNTLRAELRTKVKDL